MSHRTGRQGKFVIHRLVTEEGVPDGFEYRFWCPGCEDAHSFPVPRWEVTGDYASPTVWPSLRFQTTTTCHLFLGDGKIDFLSGCSHALAGQTVPLPDPPEWL